MDRGRCVAKEKHPRETTNFISKFSFFYIINLFKKGYIQELHFADLYDVLKNCRSKTLGDRLEHQWLKEQKRRKHPSFGRTLCLCFSKTFFTLGVIQLVVRLVLTVWSPHATSKLISYFNPNQTELTKEDGIYHACVVIGINVFSLFFNHNLQMYILALGLGVKAAVSSLLYRKSLRLNCEALSKVTVGKITTIINRDVEIFQQFVTQGNDIWISLVQTVLICWLIYNKIGLASWAGVTFFFLILPLQVLIAKLAYNYTLKCSKKRDERLEIMQEVLSAIKIIKMYTWESYFERKVCEARKHELRKLFKLYYSRIWIHVIGYVSSKVAFFIFLMSYAWMERSVTAEIAYYILSCFSDLQGALNESVPSGLSRLAEICAIIQRCELVLNCPEVALKTESTDIVCPQINFSKVSVKVSGTPVLKDVSLNINRGLNIVVGHLGSGKTTLLKTIMSDCDASGNIRIFGSISYASQDPWLFPSSIKNNILFGEEYSERRYCQVLKVCGLDYDLEMLEEGDRTIVGDRGINLSKGQQARINLARALYKNSDIYLLDDSLASLDAHVSDHIFRECIQKFLKNKIRVFVTNNFDYVQEADQIVMLEHGCIESSENMEKRGNDGDGYREDDPKTDEIAERAPIYSEGKNPGKVSLNDYYQYVSYGGGIVVFLFLMALFTIHQGISSYSEKLMSTWVTIEQNISNLNGLNDTSPQEERAAALSWYCATFITSILLYLARTFLFFFFIKTASTNMHKAMVKAIIHATMKFFDVNFIGNVLTRFSKDCITVDECLPFALIECLTMIFVAFGGVALLTSVNAVFLGEFFVLLAVAYLLKRFCQPTGRNLQRLHVMARCPMVGQVNSSLTGLSTIRASNAQNMIITEFDRYQDQFTSTHYMLDNTLIALSFSLQLFSVLFVASIIIQLLVVDSGHSVGDVGLVISQAFAISGIISNGVRVVFDCENLMTCVERILEYIRIPSEDKSGRDVEKWPQGGAIEFKHVSLHYTTKNMLTGVSFQVQPREKLGIVGRTGAGKSSIISSLLRLYPTEGEIVIDGVDIGEISLECLRSNISVIPQDPFLFSGTIRENLDPLQQHEDSKIWSVLSDLHLKPLIEDLEMTVDKGLTLSAGQRQLLCLARVILRKTKILILDEATANVDQETDGLIHEAVLRNFANCTVITIAHRLLSVMDCDKVIVMKDGEISEHDEPKKLLENKSSFFHCVVK